MSHSEKPDYSPDDIATVLEAGFIDERQADLLTGALRIRQLAEEEARKARMRLIEGLVVLSQQE